MGTHRHRQVFLAADQSHGLMCSGLAQLAEPKNRLAHVSADKCLKLCDDNHLLQRRYIE